MRSLQGEFSAMVHGLVEALVELRAWVEAAIDFPRRRSTSSPTALADRLEDRAPRTSTR